MLHRTDYCLKDGKRGFLHFLHDTYGDQQIAGAEIGTYKGENAETILATLKLWRLYLVDPYDKTLSPGYGDEITNAKAEAFERLARFGAKAFWLYQESLEAVKFIPHQLDFAYLDNLHTYSYLKEEIQQWWCVVKTGDYLMGHDYVRAGARPSMEVSVVINELAAKTGLEVYLSSDLYADWWIKKETDALDWWI